MDDGHSEPSLQQLERTLATWRVQSEPSAVELTKMISKNASPVNEFSSALWSQIESVLRTTARTSQGKLYAAFDADGTLWDADAGETFFDWQIHNSHLPALRGLDAWKHYHDLKKPDPRVAYVWLAQINAGRPLSEVRAWAAECFRAAAPWPVFNSQKKLIALLRELEIEVFIVTASIKWAVEPAAALVGVDFDHVVGVETEIRDGVITDIVKPPITWRDGKAEGLLARTGGVRPVLAAGNTYGDIALLNSATHIRLALSTQNEPGGLFDEESKLLDHAIREQWHVHRFRKR